jgi:hypothetical protein
MWPGDCNIPFGFVHCTRRGSEMKRGLMLALLLAMVATSVYYRRENARNSTDYIDPLRYERMSVDFMKEPLLAWKIVSGPKQLELTGGGQVLTCMDEHLVLGRPFDAPQQPVTIGEALDYCKALRASK